MPLARPKRQTRPAPYMLLLALARAWLARLRVCAGWLLPVCKQFMGWQLLFVLFLLKHVPLLRLDVMQRLAIK